MEPVRFNIFNQIHKGLRAMLYHTALNLQHTDFDHPGQMEEIVAKLKEVIYLFESHADIEDAMIFPLLKEVAPSLVEDFEQQHVKDHELGHQLGQALEAMQQAKPQEQIRAAAKLQYAFTEFLAFNLTHLNLEETQVNEKLWANYSDAELVALMMKIVASIPPEKNARYGFWMLKGLNLNETVHWYKEVRASAPPPVFEQFMKNAEAALPKGKFEALREKLALKPAATA